jgi:hypothetical protein
MLDTTGTGHHRRVFASAARYSSGVRLRTWSREEIVRRDSLLDI